MKVVVNKFDMTSGKSIGIGNRNYIVFGNRVFRVLYNDWLRLKREHWREVNNFKEKDKVLKFLSEMLK